MKKQNKESWIERNRWFSWFWISFIFVVLFSGILSIILKDFDYFETGVFFAFLMGVLKLLQGD